MNDKLLGESKKSTYFTIPSISYLVTRTICSLLLSFPVYFVACTNNDSGSNDTGGPDAFAGIDGLIDGSVPSLRGGCDPEDRIGYFELIVEKSSIDGEVKNATMPGEMMEEISEVGGCKLLRPNNPFCEPACKIGEICTSGNHCIPSPTNQDVGTVLVSGLARPVEMQSNAPSFLYFDTTLPQLSAEPGAAIRLVASGGVISGFELYAQVVEPLIVQDTFWTIQAGHELTIHWTAGSNENATIRVNFSVDQHGLTPVEMHCYVEDTGVLTIPSEYIDELLSFGVTAPTIGIIERRTVDSTGIDLGCIEFRSVSRVSVEVELADSVN